MARVGRCIEDPKAGRYRRLVLDSGEKVTVIPDESDIAGERVVIEGSRFMGSITAEIHTCNLDRAEGRATLRRLTRETRTGSLRATPLGAFVHYVGDSSSLAEIKAEVAALQAVR
jgi:hypothetical protein